MGLRRWWRRRRSPPAGRENWERELDAFVPDRTDEDLFDYPRDGYPDDFKLLEDGPTEKELRNFMDDLHRRAERDQER